MKKVALVILVFISISSLSAQIDIGSTSSELVSFIELRYQETKKKDPFGTKDLAFEYEIKRYNGKITNLIVSQRNQIIIDLLAKSDITTNYIIEDGIVTSIQTGYPGLTQEYIEEKFDERYGNRKHFDFYFSEDYQYFRCVTFEEGIAVVSNHEAVYPNLGKYMLGEIKKLQEEYKKNQ